MDMCPEWVRFYQANIPFIPGNEFFISNSINVAPAKPAVNWPLNQGLLISPLERQLPIAPNNYMLPPTLSDEAHFRHRRQFRIRELSPIWIPSQQSDQSLVNNSIQTTEKIISILNADPTGGSKIVTRRRQDGSLDVRIIYSRGFIVAASASPYALLPPANFRQMVLGMMDIIAKFPKSYYNSIRADIISNSSL